MNDLIERLNMLAGRMMATTVFGKDAHTVLEAASVLALRELDRSEPDAALEQRAKKLFEESAKNYVSRPSWEELHEDTRELWINFARMRA